MPRPTFDGGNKPFYEKYVNLVQGDSVEEAMANHAAAVKTFYLALPEDKADYAYAEGKWTIKDVLQHVTDAERIFSYRLLRISRGDTTPLPGFEENDYAVAAHAGKRSMQELKDEFAAVRTATDHLLASLGEEEYSRVGTSNNNPIAANTIGFLLYGHLLHHQAILEERYGI